MNECWSSSIYMKKNLQKNILTSYIAFQSKMKRKFKDECKDSYTSQSTMKRRKLDNNNKVQSTCTEVHRMRLRYASNVDRLHYDKCPKCLTINNYESMHFIYACISCSFFVCNFCMADLYNNSNTNLKITNKLIKQQSYVTKNKITKTNTEVQSQDTNNTQRISIGSQLLIPDDALDENGYELNSYQLHTVKRIDKYGNILTNYGELDLTNISYYVVDKKIKKCKIGQTVASRWPFKQRTWAQFYIGTLLEIEHIKNLNGTTAKYTVQFLDIDDVVSKVIPIVSQ
eukprot:540416_1